MNNPIDTLVVVDAGHGGIDSGAVGNGLEEKNLNLKAAKHIYERLQELNIPTVITRTEDEYLPKSKRIERIKSLTNNNPNNILISNHINAGGAEGAEIVYSLNNNSTLADLILTNIEKKGQKVRKTYQRRLPENPNQDYYYILRETNSNEPLLIEYGFIDNIKDAEKLENNIIDYAEAVVESIAFYLGYQYQKEPNNEEYEEYIVKANDTLYSIGKKFNISVDELKKINNLTSNTLSVGQIIKLNHNNKQNNSIYIVKKGDTLYSISRMNNIPIEEIIELNQLSSSNLYPGQELYLSLNDENIDYQEDEEYEIYNVKRGDSLWSISKNYNISVPELIDLNNLNNLTIQIDQKLLVPRKNLKEYYIVEKGDSLWSIAKKYNTTVNNIKELNNLDTNLLSVGQKLIIKNEVNI